MCQHFLRLRDDIFQNLDQFQRAIELLAAAFPDSLRIDLYPMIEDLQLGPDYRWEVGGELEQSAETMDKLMRWLPICVFGIAVLLIWPLLLLARLARENGPVPVDLTATVTFDFFQVMPPGSTRTHEVSKANRIKKGIAGVIGYSLNDSEPALCRQCSR